MKYILPVALLFFSFSHAGEYLNEHRDSYEVILRSSNFSSTEKTLFQAMFNQCILKDQLLCILENASEKQIHNEKAKEIEQLVAMIDEQTRVKNRLHQQLSLSDREKAKIISNIAAAYEYVEDLDFEIKLHRIRNWNAAKLGRFFHDIYKYTTRFTFYGGIEKEHENIIILEGFHHGGIQVQNEQLESPCTDD